MDDRQTTPTQVRCTGERGKANRQEEAELGSTEIRGLKSMKTKEQNGAGDASGLAVQKGYAGGAARCEVRLQDATILPREGASEEAMLQRLE